MHQANKNTHQDKTRKRVTMVMEMIKPITMEIATKMKRLTH